MAEVLGVFNAATKSVDGQMTLAPNTVPWAANDAVEEPHYYQEKIGGDIQFIAQTTPRPYYNFYTGVQYQLNVGPDFMGSTIWNAAPASNYFGNGGTHLVPEVAYEALGIWRRTMDAQAGEKACSRSTATRMGAASGTRGTTCLNWIAVLAGIRFRFSR